MGDDLSTGAKIGIGLVILCFLIAIVLSLLMVVKNITNSGANQLESGLGQMMATTYDDYDQKIVTGTKVTSAIKLFSGEPIGIVSPGCARMPAPTAATAMVRCLRGTSRKARTATTPTRAVPHSLVTREIRSLLRRQLPRLRTI